jgi:hypothetical protein
MIVVGIPGRAWSQTHDPDAAAMAATDEAHPTLHIHGFSDVDYVASDATGAHSGFQLGQFALHFSSALARKTSFFGEVTATPNRDAYAFEVERSFVRYDYNDAFKISFGRFHTPIGYWNDAFHHGLWLQTTIRRPEQVRIGGIYVPVHFVGLKAEGDIPSGPLGLGYEAGIGNGRSEVLSRAGDAGDPNTNRAWLVDLLVHPIVPYGLKAGVSAYRDRLSIAAQPAIDEWIISGYAAWTRETPELIGEYIGVRHHDSLTGADHDSRAFYVQAACRLPGRVHVVKPYARYEKLDVASADPVFGFPDQQVVTGGARFDLMALAAFKVEYRNELTTGAPRVNDLLLQACFTF